MKKLLIAGSRNLKPAPEEFDAAVKLLDPTNQRFEVITGGARGVDTAGAWWAAISGHIDHTVHADWDKHGKKAGYIRNAEMVAMEPDYAIIFWDGQSRGTAHTLNLIKQTKAKYVVVISPQGTK